jgi:uncharacterized protein involved in type VI secretion and phage assembly
MDRNTQLGAEIRPGRRRRSARQSMSFLPIDRSGLQALRASKIRGVQLAVVVDNKDGPDNPGYRVKLKLPWLNEQESTFWAWAAVPMGGSGRGTYMLPEIDDQVLVVFEHGDIDRPIVIGALWSKKQDPVEVNQGARRRGRRAQAAIALGRARHAQRLGQAQPWRTRRYRSRLDTSPPPCGDGPRGVTVAFPGPVGDFGNLVAEEIDRVVKARAACSALAIRRN